MTGGGTCESSAGYVGHELNGSGGSAPISAKTQTFHRPVGPIAYDCVKVIIVRDGSAILFSEFGQRLVKLGDVVLLCANTLCGSEPECPITATTVYMDTDYLIDQVFWQHVGLLCDRLDARELASAMYVEPAQVLRLGEQRVGLVMPWLDELVRLTVDGDQYRRFNRVQALWFSLADVIAPFVKVSPVRLTPSQRERIRPTLPRHRQFNPLRTEARKIADLLRSELARRWTLDDLAGEIHLSVSQMTRVFTDAFGKTPLAYLTIIRAEELARLLRDTDLPIEAAMRQVGWHSRGHGSQLFRQYVGITPIEYRRLSAATA
ncbi:AraC family transcriptional regulator [Bifidobacterium subtile]|jgi:AraC-like DNA-binding protein|uniref:AraC family transcriptional regulator n=1 Tax=Bifidobacterium subtile TaxID=77635 RepID=UPI002F34F2A9